MPQIVVTPHDPDSLRRSIAELASGNYMLRVLATHTRELYNQYHRAWTEVCRELGKDSDLARKLHSMTHTLEYQYNRLNVWAIQLEENWDLAMSLKDDIFDDHAFVSPATYGLPVDLEHFLTHEDVEKGMSDE